jgi:hypothetical protein
MKPKYKIGDKVRIKYNKSGSRNPISSIGIISNMALGNNNFVYRVIVKHYTDEDMVNWQHEDELELIMEELDTEAGFQGGGKGDGMSGFRG